jgi:hypothetical protein
MQNLKAGIGEEIFAMLAEILADLDLDMKGQVIDLLMQLGQFYDGLWTMGLLREAIAFLAAGGTSKQFDRTRYDLMRLLVGVRFDEIQLGMAAPEILETFDEVLAPEGRYGQGFVHLWLVFRAHVEQCMEAVRGRFI